MQVEQNAQCADPLPKDEKLFLNLHYLTLDCFKRDLYIIIVIINVIITVIMFCFLFESEVRPRNPM